MDTDSVQVSPIGGHKLPITTIFGNLTENSGERRSFGVMSVAVGPTVGRWANPVYFDRLYSVQSFEKCQN